MYPGIDGFLGTRASFMLDVVVLAMVVVLPVLAISIYLVRYRRQYQIHKWMQIGLGAVLLIAVTLFELDIRLNGWRERAVASKYYGTETSLGLVDQVLYIHLFFAVSTFVLWIVVMIRALRGFSNPPAPGPHSASHLLWARIAALDMACTSVTGWTFYWLAFVQ
jgi:hypothetical protein